MQNFCHIWVLQKALQENCGARQLVYHVKQEALVEGFATLCIFCFHRNQHLQYAISTIGLFVLSPAALKQAVLQNACVKQHQTSCTALDMPDTET